MPCPQCARSAPAVQSFYVGKYSFPLPYFPGFVTHYTDSMPICIFCRDFRHQRIRLFCGVAASARVEEFHLIWVVFDTCARSAPAVRPQCKVCPWGWGAGPPTGPCCAAPIPTHPLPPDGSGWPDGPLIPQKPLIPLMGLEGRGVQSVGVGGAASYGVFALQAVHWFIARGSGHGIGFVMFRTPSTAVLPRKQSPTSHHFHQTFFAKGAYRCSRLLKNFLPLRPACAAYCAVSHNTTQGTLARRAPPAKLQSVSHLQSFCGMYERAMFGLAQARW